MEEDNRSVLTSTNQLIDLFSLPEEMLFNGIFPNLGYEDILRLRRVCKYLKSLSDSFIRINFNSHVREINETSYPFQLYLQTNLPTTSIYINNLSPSIFKDPHIPSFLNLHGDKITSLKINHFTTFISEHELNFFSNLPNLLHLDISFIDASLRDCSITSQTSGVHVADLRVPCPFPQNFKTLKTLKLNQIKGSHVTDHGYPWELISFCQNLEYIRHPIFDNIVGGAAELPATLGRNGPFTFIIELIKSRHRQRIPPNLKLYDLLNFQRTYAFFDHFCELINLCFDNNIKLVNVPGQLLEHVFPNFGTTPEKYGNSLVSLINIHGYCFYTELPILEKLTIKSICNSSWMNMQRDEERDGERGEDGVAKWPGLKSVDLTIDSFDVTTYYPEEGDYNCSSELIEFLFPGKEGKREGVLDLAIRYPDDEIEKRSEFNNYGPLPLVNARSIADTCPFVKRLTLTCWEGGVGRRDGDFSICGFWRGLEFLEEVELENCEKIGDEGFVGMGSWEDPVFLKLKNLKNLTLKGLQGMGLTDKVFEMVFRNLKIREFQLTSGKPVESITAAGIESLLTGDFNKYVEKFPFHGWSLNGVSDEEFSKMKLKFRASDMI